MTQTSWSDDPLLQGKREGGLGHMGVQGESSVCMAGSVLKAGRRPEMTRGGHAEVEEVEFGF